MALLRISGRPGRLRCAFAIWLVLALAVSPALARALPSGFFGVVPQGQLQPSDFERMGRLGLDLRLPIFWYSVEPRPGEFDFVELDRIFGEAADAGVRILPQLGGTPPWIAANQARPPLGRAGLGAWSEFLRQMVDRYGSGGAFWQGRVEQAPVRLWQIWNEPNFPVFWAPRPAPRGYARLLHRSATAIRAADVRARIVVAGLAPIEHEIEPWEFLRRLYRVPRVKHDFDFVALHPYASTVRGLEFEVRMTRQVMARAGDSKTPLMITEFGVASDARLPTIFDRGPGGQARFLERAYDRLLAERHRWRIAAAYWYAWNDSAALESHCVFCQYTGLFDHGGSPKPAWWALKRVVAEAVR